MVVERAGELNRDAGPDFFDARVTIDGIRWAGNVEIHVRASDWKAHHHSEDKKYNNVILHVVYIHDADVVLENGKTVATVAVADNIPEHVWENYEELMSSEESIACSSRLERIPDFLMHISQERLTVERMERKTDDARRLLDEARGSWEKACYWLTARYFGGKTNAFAFELLAKKTPMTIVAKKKDNPFRIESLYFGQAGLLEGDFDDEYPRAMQREYSYLRAAYNLRPMDGHLWKFLRLYPASFPTLRISQFACLMAWSHGLFSKLLESRDVRELRLLFDVETSDYWQTHYIYDNESRVRSRKLGKMAIDRLLINAWAPLLFEYGVMHDDQSRKDQAFALLRQLPAERNKIISLWENAGVKPSNAAESQALIELYNEYCMKKRCLECQLGGRVLKIGR